MVDLEAEWAAPGIAPEQLERCIRPGTSAGLTPAGLADWLVREELATVGVGGQLLPTRRCREIGAGLGVERQFPTSR